MLAGLTLTALCLALFVARPELLQPLSSVTFDAFARHAARAPACDRIAIVDIDEDSLARHGQWPWSRCLLAELTDRILEAGPGVLAFDIVFAEPDRTSPHVLGSLLRERFGRQVGITGLADEFHDFDALFAGSLTNAPTILGCYMHLTDSGTEPTPTNDPHFRGHTLTRAEDGTASPAPWLLQSGGVTAPLPELRAAAASTAFFNATPDADNIVRTTPLLVASGPERIYGSLALEAARLLSGRANVLVEYGSQGVQSIRVGKTRIPTDAAGRMALNFRQLNTCPRSGVTGSYSRFSAADILDGCTDITALEGKVVFVGTSAPGLRDLRTTPVCREFAGVEIHATALDNILSGDMLVNSPDWFPGAHAAAILLLGVGLTIGIHRGRAILSMVLTLTVVSACLVCAFLSFSRLGMVFLPTWLIVTTMLVYLTLTGLKYWEEEQHRKRLRTMFGTMVSHEVLSYMDKNPESFSLKGKKTEATMLFCDIANFTSISERLAPEQLSQLLNRYFTPMTELVMARNGYVDKFEGDLIMAVWGVPFATDDHAVQACLAALEQQQRLALLRPQLKEEFGVDVYARTGINTGTVTAGNMGSDKRFSYTVLGDAANQAARFEPANKLYGTSIIVGAATYTAARNSVEARFLDRIFVRGKSHPVDVYELLAPRGTLSQKDAEKARLYQEAWDQHAARQWDDALALLDQLLELVPDDAPAAVLHQRITTYQRDPPPSTWTGEWQATRS